ncbi:DMT family transporter [Kistimonas scapharcae]|uniref:DMT family transporter n=1 Tax=Kistimonas scapharcae TaxID=1036133 RepID=A0ABP8V2M9_9GAMM
MRWASALCLVSLAAIWGSSFLFIRISVPVLGPALLMEVRAALAAVFLLVTAGVLKKSLPPIQNWRHFLILGFVNSALPFLLFAYAVQMLTASLLSVISATAPLWGALIGALWYRKPLMPRQTTGLFLGLAGVSVLVGYDSAAQLEGASFALVAGFGAASLYGVASVYAQAVTHIAPFDNAHGSMWAATLLLLPLVPFSPVDTVPDAPILLAVLMLGVLCTGFAYLLYFRLVADVGASAALSVTFLIPVFGIFWGYLFLGEPVGWHTVLGTLLVLLGTALVTGFLPRFRQVVLSKAVDHE